MARETQVLTNANDICGPILIPDEDTHYATLAIDNAADGSVVLEASLQDDGAGVDQWVTLGIIPASGGAVVLLLTGSGANQMGTSNPTAARKFRVRKSVAGTGPMRVTLSVGCL